MNVVKFYRLRRDGTVETLLLKVSQRKRKKRQGMPTVRQAEDHMLVRGWSREKPRPTQRVTIADAVRRALAVA